MKPEVAKYLGLFTTESLEHLNQLSELLIRLEKTSEADLETIVDELMRHAHSIKGMAGMMELGASSGMAHHLEDWFSALGRLPRSLVRELLTTQLIDALLVAVDHLAQIIQAELKGESLPEQPVLIDFVDRQMAEAVQTSQSFQTPISVDVGEEDLALDLSTLTAPCFRLRLTIVSSSQMATMRAFLAYKKLAALGPILHAIPSIDGLRAGGSLPDRVLTLVISAEPGEIHRVLETLTDVERTELSPLDIASKTHPGSDASSENETTFGDVAKPVPDVHAPPVSPPELPPSALAALPASLTAASLTSRTPTEKNRTLRVKVELLDTLLDSVGDFILSIARLREQAGETPQQPPSGGNTSPLIEGLDALHLQARSIHNQVLAARMMPLSAITDQMHRVARDLARQRGRLLEFSLSGVEVELDHAVLAVLADPLLHLVRNAVDHGIESPDERTALGKPRIGRLSLTARREHTHVLIELSDDGRGLSAEKLKARACARGMLTPAQCDSLNERDAWRLCFLPGLSTAEQLSDISGRGVGMDVVKNAIEGVGGSIDLSSRTGEGTTWTLALPYTVAIAHLLFVRLGSERFGIPIARIAHVTTASAEDFSINQGQRFFSWRGELLPVFSLGSRLRIATDVSIESGEWPLILFEGEERLLALQVDALLGQQRSILRPLRPPLDRISFLAGVTLQTSGMPAFILDVPRLFAQPRSGI